MLLSGFLTKKTHPAASVSTLLESITLQNWKCQRKVRALFIPPMAPPTCLWKTTTSCINMSANRAIRFLKLPNFRLGSGCRWSWPSYWQAKAWCTPGYSQTTAVHHSKSQLRVITIIISNCIKNTAMHTQPRVSQDVKTVFIIITKQNKPPMTQCPYVWTEMQPK